MHFSGMISTEQSGLQKQSAHVLNTRLACEGKVFAVALGDPTQQVGRVGPM